jgi:hypothetical protein
MWGETARAPLTARHRHRCLVITFAASSPGRPKKQLKMINPTKNPKRAQVYEMEQALLYGDSV